MGMTRRPTFALMAGLAGALLLVALVPRPARTSDKPAAEAAAIPDQHDRPIVEEDGRRLLWAGEDDEGNVEWFDMTDSLIDPHRFQFGIGKDVISSIDEPVFVAANDPRLAERGITRETQVLGVEIGGIARAYPVDLMTMHEVVNDEFDGKAYAVLW
jgi:hypothetical protein